MAKKKKKGTAEAGGAGVSAPANKEIDKEVLLDQLLLRERVREMEEKNRVLAQANTTLSAKLTQQQQDQADVFYHLHRKIDQTQETVTSLETAREETEREAASEAKQLRLQITKLEKDINTREAAHETEVFSLRQELIALNQFAKNKAKYESRIQELEKLLKEETLRRTREVADMELEKVREKERLKKDMLVKIKETKRSLLRLTEDQLETTTKRTILENEQLATELQYQSRETEKLLARLGTLEHENKVLRRNLDLVDAEKLGHARKANLYWKLSQTLQDQQTREEGKQQHEAEADRVYRRQQTLNGEGGFSAVGTTDQPFAKRVQELLRANRKLQSELATANDLLNSTARVIDTTLTEYDLEKMLKATLYELQDCLKAHHDEQCAMRLRGLVTRRKMSLSRQAQPLPVWQRAPSSGGLLGSGKKKGSPDIKIDAPRSNDNNSEKNHGPRMIFSPKPPPLKSPRPQLR